MPARSSFVPSRQWRDPRHVRGLRGEQIALAWLTARGWQVEAHRFRAGRHDLDLVIRRGHLVAFVEVKTRASVAHGDPLESIGWQKVRSLIWTAQCWQARHGRPGDVYRFDVVTVRLRRGRKPEVCHLDDAFRR